jgi:hypothetical protein
MYQCVIVKIMNKMETTGKPSELDSRAQALAFANERNALLLNPNATDAEYDELAKRLTPEIQVELDVMAAQARRGSVGNYIGMHAIPSDGLNVTGSGYGKISPPKS